MKKYILSFIFIYFFLLLVPLVASAAIEYSFGGMGNDPNPCQYTSTLFIWGLGIVGAVAVTAIAYGGFRYMVGQVQEGKEIIYSALLGLLLLMASWLILYTINPDLATLKCSTAGASTTSSTTTTTSPSTPSTPSTPSSSTDKTVRDQLTKDSGGKITENKTCTDSSSCSVSGGQTCLNGLQSSTISGVENIQKGCNCAIVITGGTECGHGANHTAGKKVDLRSTDPTLNNYIYGQISNTNPTPYQAYKGKDGYTYMYETGPPHWDICFSC